MQANFFKPDQQCLNEPFKKKNNYMKRECEGNGTYTKSPLAINVQ